MTQKLIPRLLRAVFAPLPVPASSTADVSWASTSLIGSIRHVVFMGTAVLQLGMTGITLLVPGPGVAVLAAVQLALCIVAVAAVSGRLPPRIADVVPIGMMMLGLWGYLVSGDLDSILTFAACWQIDFGSCFAAMLILGRAVLVLVPATAVVIAGTIVVLLPDWAPQLPVSIVVTQIAIVVALRLGLPSLFRLAAATDVAAAAVEEATRRAALRQAARARIAEEARALHDTAVNTFGAIANGVSSADADRVRAQCARDVARLDVIRSARRAPLRTLDDLFGPSPLRVRRSGLDDHGLRLVAEIMPPPVVDAIVGCAQEAVRNAAKHAGVNVADIDVTRTDDELLVVISDAGVGFVTADADAAGRGIARSIVARARDNGFTADLVSAPGHGTSVTLAVPLRDRPASADEQTRVPGRVVEALHGTAGGLWGLGVTVVGLVLLLAGGANQHLSLIPMLAVMLLAWTLPALPAVRRAPRVLTVALLCCTCVVFLLAAAATDFGRSGAAHLQSLAATGPFVLLLSWAPSARVRAVCAAVWAGVVVIAAATVAVDSWTAAGIVLVAGAVGLGFAAVWARFQSVVRALTRDAVALRRREFAAALQGEAEQVASATYTRWSEAGIDAAAELLQRIATGELAPDAPETRAACAAEERYLRQLLLISPDLVHLGHVIMPTLRLARERGIEYALRLGDVDAPDADAAGRIATSVLDGLAATRSGSRFVASVFPVHDGLQVTLLGEGLAALAVDTGTDHRRVGDLDLVEIHHPDELEDALA